MAAALGILGGSAVTGAIGQQEFNQSMNQAQQARQQALQNYLNIHVPDPAQQQIILKNYAVTGQLSPEMEQAVNQGATELASMNVNPQGRAAEVQALQQMTKLSQSGGMDAEARQQMEQGLQAANANEAGQVGAITQNFAARGQGGSGAQLAAELQGTQTDANSSANAGMSAASSAEQRALQAMTAEGSMGSNLETQDYGQAAAKAQAQDTINNFNARNQQGVSNANVTAANQAQAANLANAQAVSNSNTGLANQQEVSNKALLQQQFNNQMGLAGSESAAELGIASGYQAQGQGAANMWGNIGNAVGQGVAALSKDSSGSNTNTTQTPTTSGPTTSSNVDTGNVASNNNGYDEEEQV